MALRSPRSPRVRNLAPTAQNSGLPLPYELRELILRYLLVSKEDTLELIRGVWPLYHLGDVYVRSITGGYVSHVNDRTLSKDFRVLTQVSRKMRSDAITVLFYRNKWRLLSSLCRDEDAWGSDRLEGWDSASMVRKRWGAEAILSIRNLKITIEVESKTAQKRIQGYLQRLVKMLESSRNLRKLEVEWLDHDSLDRNSCESRRNHQRAMIQRVARDADGKKASTKHFKNGVSRWEEGQKILKPLESLRGIPEVVVMGCVTDKWAVQLEKCMKSGRPMRKKRVPKRKAKVSSVGLNAPS